MIFKREVGDDTRDWQGKKLRNLELTIRHYRTMYRFYVFIHLFNRYLCTSFVLDIMLSAGDTEVKDIKSSLSQGSCFKGQMCAKANRYRWREIQRRWLTSPRRSRPRGREETEEEGVILHT